MLGIVDALPTWLVLQAIKPICSVMRKLILFPVAILISLIFTGCSKSDKELDDFKLTIVIDNKEYVFNDDMVDLTMDNTGAMGMSWEGPDGMGSMTWEVNDTGRFQWNDNTNQFLFEPDDISPRQAFQSYYNDGLEVSTGEVTISESGEIISGRIFIQQAGRTNTESGNGEYMGESRLTGSFILRRDY